MVTAKSAKVSSWSSCEVLLIASERDSLSENFSEAEADSLDSESALLKFLTFSMRVSFSSIKAALASGFLAVYLISSLNSA
jgi:hypothetical protein